MSCSCLIFTWHIPHTKEIKSKWAWLPPRSQLVAPCLPGLFSRCWGIHEQKASELYYWNPRKELPYQSRACKIPPTWNMAPKVSEQTQEQLLYIGPYKDRTQLPSRAAPRPMPFLGGRGKEELSSQELIVSTLLKGLTYFMALG